MLCISRVGEVEALTTALACGAAFEGLWYVLTPVYWLDFKFQTQNSPLLFEMGNLSKKSILRLPVYYQFFVGYRTLILNLNDVNSAYKICRTNRCLFTVSFSTVN